MTLTEAPTSDFGKAVPVSETTISCRRGPIWRATLILITASAPPDRNEARLSWVTNPPASTRTLYRPALTEENWNFPSRSVWVSRSTVSSSSRITRAFWTAAPSGSSTLPRTVPAPAADEVTANAAIRKGNNREQTTDRDFSLRILSSFALGRADSSRGWLDRSPDSRRMDKPPAPSHPDGQWLLAGF